MATKEVKTLKCSGCGTKIQRQSHTGHAPKCFECQQERKRKAARERMKALRSIRKQEQEDLKKVTEELGETPQILKQLEKEYEEVRASAYYANMIKDYEFNKFMPYDQKTKRYQRVFSVCNQR